MTEQTLGEREAIATWLERHAATWVKPTALNYPKAIRDLAAQIRQGEAAK